MVSFVRPSSVTIGEAALTEGAPQHRLVGVKRLLGRKYDARNAATLDAAAELLACPLHDDGSDVKLCLSHERVNSQLRKRGEPPRVVGDEKNDMAAKLYAARNEGTADAIKNIPAEEGIPCLVFMHLLYKCK